MGMCEELLRKGYNIEPLLAIEDFKNTEFKSAYPQYSKMVQDCASPNGSNTEILSGSVLDFYSIKMVRRHQSFSY